MRAVSGDNVFLSLLFGCMENMKSGCVQLLMKIYSDHSLEIVDCSL